MKNGIAMPVSRVAGLSRGLGLATGNPLSPQPRDRPVLLTAIPGLLLLLSQEQFLRVKTTAWPGCASPLLCRTARFCFVFGGLLRKTHTKAIEYPHIRLPLTSLVLIFKKISTFPSSWGNMGVPRSFLLVLVPFLVKVTNLNFSVYVVVSLRPLFNGVGRCTTAGVGASVFPLFLHGRDAHRRVLYKTGLFQHFFLVPLKKMTQRCKTSRIARTDTTSFL